MHLGQAQKLDFNIIAYEQIAAEAGLLPISNRLKLNCRGFWHTYRMAIFIFTLALIADGLSTVYFMSYLGVSAEIHPVVRFASVAFGPVAGPVVGSLWKWAACLYLAIYCRKFAYSIFLTTSIVYIFAAWYNIWGIYLLV
ncbi:MAG: hypothetical protein ABSF37_08855 [Sedimentisphaerales bacterium]|jgi:hypothetical protein